MKLNLFLSFGSAAIFSAFAADAQSITPDVMNNSGGHAVVSGRVFEWSVGEMVVTTQTGGTITVTQGLLQPNDPPAGVADMRLAPMLDVYPNPTTSIVNIVFSAPSSGTLTYRLMDITGKVVQEQSKEVKQGMSTEQMDLRTLANASYMLQVLFSTPTSSALSSSYKIQKIN